MLNRNLTWRDAGGRVARLAVALFALGPWVAHALDQPPSVTLTAPSAGASFFAPATIQLAANASDPDGTVVRVDFFQGTTLIGTSTSAPFTATWSNVPIGNYSLTAKATDNGGKSTTSSPVSIWVVSATTLVISGPSDGQAVDISQAVITGTFEGGSDSTVFVDDGNSTVMATVFPGTPNAWRATLPLAIGSTTITARLNRTDGVSATRSITVTGYAPPVVVFTGPSCNTFDPPASITLTVDAKSPGATVTSVSYYNGSTLLGTATAPPYQVTWTNVPTGQYILVAIAQDDHGTTGNDVTQIVVNAPNVPPSISITSPASGATFNAPATVPIAVNATDSDGTVTLVEFFGDGALLGATSTAPFGFTWSNVAAGSHTLTARATDNRNGQTLSAPVSITVNSPPTATLTAPVSGASFNPPATVTLTATASDTDGAVVKVEFYQGAILIGTATAAPYAASWSVLAPGTYTLTAKAYDNLGGTGVSAPVSVTVAGSVTFLHNDFAGNPIAATDANGALLWKENFRPYGDRLNNPAAASGNRQWFHGKPADADTGLSYFGARYYDPTVGRFMGVDTVGLDPTRLYTFNRYAYGNNNPYKYVDPDGRFAREAVVLASVFAIAAIVSSTDARKQFSKAFQKLWNILQNEAQDPSEASGDKGKSPDPNAESAEGNAEGNTNPYNGPVDKPVIVVDPHGNAIPVDKGQQITASPNGDYQQVRDSEGKVTGVRLDRGGHPKQNDPLARGPHGHVPGVTTPEGNPHLPIKPPSSD
jgi:RHS repeat-associated protein